MTSAISRQLSICTFADEKGTTPKQSGTALLDRGRCNAGSA